MRKLMIVAGTVAALASFGAIRTASAAEANPASAAATATHTPTSLNDAWGHRVYPAQTRRTPTDRNLRRDSDAHGARTTSHSVPSRGSDQHAGQWNSGTDDARAKVHQQAPSRFAQHGERTPVHHTSRTPQSSQDTNGRRRESTRGDRG